jgi:purine-nucleoside phosphorylase
MSLPEFTYGIINFLKKKDIPSDIEAAVILGSGLGSFTSHIQSQLAIPYKDIPSMPNTTVKGHDGKLIFGSVKNQSVMAFSGRYHHYEGYSLEQTATPVYLAKALGAKKLIISNAAGAINTSFSVGDLMIIEDVIRGPVSISPCGYLKYRYLHHKWVDCVGELAAELQLVTQPGTYMYVTGPNYETKAEIRAFRRMGADSVGMSTATELSEAARLKIKSTAISLISNMATGLAKGKLDHNEVSAVANSRKDDFAKLVKKLIMEF